MCIGFLIHKSLINSIVKIESVSSRVAYHISRITQQYSLKVIQVFATYSKWPDVDVDLAMYDDISKAMHAPKKHFTVILLQSKRGMGNGYKLRVKFGYGQRHQRSQRSVDFIQGLFAMNLFFKKRSLRKWTWLWLAITARYISEQEAGAENRVKPGSNHRMVYKRVIEPQSRKKNKQDSKKRRVKRSRLGIDF